MSNLPVVFLSTRRAAAALACACALLFGCKGPATDALKPLTSKYAVGGSVSGLSGSGLVLQVNGGDDLAVSGNGSFMLAMALAAADDVLPDNGGNDLPDSANGTFTFTTGVASGSPYAVTIKTQPSNPAQTCTVASGSGTIGTANVTNVAVSCSDDATATVTATGTAVGIPSLQTIAYLRGIGLIAGADSQPGYRRALVDQSRCSYFNQAGCLTVRPGHVETLPQMQTRPHHGISVS